MAFIQLGWVSRVDEMILARERSGFAGKKYGATYKLYLGCLDHYTRIFSMDNDYRNPGTLQFEGPRVDYKDVSLCVEDLDYMGCIKELNDYLDKIFHCVWRDRMWPDDWTAINTDGKRSAQFEHTLLQASMIYCIIRVRDGPRDKMKEFDNNVPHRQFDNFQECKLQG
ncbi:hypothetical protein Tco_0313891 [Tanacetum coccineum]